MAGSLPHGWDSCRARTPPAAKTIARHQQTRRHVPTNAADSRGAIGAAHLKRHPDRTEGWLARVADRRNPNIAAVALANKNARIVWALLAHGRDYQAGYRRRRNGG